MVLCTKVSGKSREREHTRRDVVDVKVRAGTTTRETVVHRSPHVVKCCSRNFFTTRVADGSAEKDKTLVTNKKRGRPSEFSG